ncbi:MAG: pseudaminic acid cytidylyltransferase [Bermanella sp.]
MNICIIPARGGSKRIPRKNIKPFMGRPMMAYSIEAAIESECFDRIIVSTDDEEMARVAVSLGAEVPFMRPAFLADDHTATVPVIKHAIESIMAAGEQVTFACCIYATAPFIRAADLKQAFLKLKQANSDYCLSVTDFTYPIQRSLRVTAAGSIEMLYPENYLTRSQDLEPTYHDAGQFYFGRCQAWLSQKPILAAGSLPFIIPRSRVQDIDTPEDWQQAEIMYQLLNHKK